MSDPVEMDGAKLSERDGMLQICQRLNDGILRLEKRLERMGDLKQEAVRVIEDQIARQVGELAWVSEAVNRLEGVQ